MPAEPFRFLHAADLHLEQPIAALDEIPDHLRDALIDAPRRAAEQVFDAAIVEEVDFVVLSGDVIDPERAEAGAMAFLVEQLERLAEHDIDVYWAAAAIDASNGWPASLPLPDRVHVFDNERVETKTHYRDKLPLAKLVGQSDSGRRLHVAGFHREESDAVAPCTIAVAHGSVEAESLITCPIDYWALGGRHQRARLLTSPCTAVYAGTPQGRTQSEHGPHGCTLVRVDEDGKFHPRFLATDVVRWHVEHLHLSPETTRDALEAELRSRAAALIEAAAGRKLLISWPIAGDGPLSVKLRRGNLAVELTDWLRREFGRGEAPAWTIAVEAPPAAEVPEACYEEDTILGDFLRTLRYCRAHETESLNVDHHLSAGAQAELSEITPYDEQEQQQVFDEVATLALDLLRGTQGP